MGIKDVGAKLNFTPSISITEGWSRPSGGGTQKKDILSDVLLLWTGRLKSIFEMWVMKRTHERKSSYRPSGRRRRRNSLLPSIWMTEGWSRPAARETQKERHDLLVMSFFLELVGWLEHLTCWLRISCSTDWATLAFMLYDFQMAPDASFQKCTHACALSKIPFWRISTAQDESYHKLLFSSTQNL